MKQIPRLKGPSTLPAIAGLAILTLGLSLRADDALVAAADALAKAGGDYLRASGVAPVRASTPTTAVASNEVGGKAPTVATVAPVAEPPFEGVFVGALGPGAGNLRARFAGGKVEWVKSKKFREDVTNAYTFTAAGGRVTVTRAGAAPLVYRIGEGRKSLALESGDGELVAKELQASQP